MGLTAISSAASAISLSSPVGAGVGGAFVVLALVLLLGYLNVFEASDRTDSQVLTMLYATITPLAFTFGAIILFQSVQVL